MPARRAGQAVSIVGIASWMIWLGWRIGFSASNPIGVVVLAFEVVAFLATAVITAALWLAPTRRWTPAVSGPLPDVIAEVLGVSGHGAVESQGRDDTGEVALARRALDLLDPRSRHRTGRPYHLAATAWAVVAVEGIRRLFFVVGLVLLLLSGRLPFTVPSASIATSLVAGQLLLAVGHWLLSSGAVRPGARARWSMASIGAGLGDGTSRTGLPIRWAATMATVVVLNLAVSLRGVSDRWTHGLGAMPRDERIAAMGVSWWLVIVAFCALHTLAKPSLGFYGATKRLEEPSTRRLALGSTLAVAMVGFIAGALPGGLPA